MNTQDRKNLRKILEEQGYKIEIDRWPQRLTYYKPDGEPLPNLPADPWSMQRYLQKGFTLKPPVKEPVVPSNGGNEEAILEPLNLPISGIEVVKVEPKKVKRKRKKASKKRESKKGDK